MFSPVELHQGIRVSTSHFLFRASLGGRIEACPNSLLPLFDELLFALRCNPPSSDGRASADGRRGRASAWLREGVREQCSA